MIRTLTLFLAACTLCSCISMGRKVDEGQLRQFEKGRTTYYDVVNALGRPTSATLHSDGSREVVYTYSQSQLKPENFVPFLALFTQGATTEMTTVSLTFDPQDRLVLYSATQGSMVVGTGLTSGARQ